MSETGEPVFYTKQQVAEKLQVTERQVGRLVAAGRLRAVRLGGRVRITAAELQRLAQGGS